MLSYGKTHPEPGLKFIDKPEPEAPGSGEVLVSVEAAGICGSDVHVLNWEGDYGFMVPHLPVTLGHEFAGTVIGVGKDVARIAPGDRVTVWPSSPCSNCATCKAEQPQRCLNRHTVGLSADGAFAPQVTVPAIGVFRIPDKVDLEIAALAEPLCVGRRAVGVGDVKPGDKVVVLGPGTIGQAIAIFARKAGASAVAVAGFDDAARLEVCSQLGFSDRYDLAEKAGRAALVKQWSGADVVFEATGKAASITDGLQLLKPEGVLVMTGIHPEPVTLAPIDFVRRKLQIRASHGTRKQDWAAVVEMLEQNDFHVRPMITHRLPLARIDEGFELARNRSASKVMIFPQKKTRLNGEGNW